MRFCPLQRSLAALRCLGLPYPKRSRFSLAPPARMCTICTLRGGADSCGFPPAFALRSRDLIRRERRRTGPLSVAATMGGDITRRPVRRRDLGELAARRRSWGSALRSLDPECRLVGCFHPSWPTCRSPNVHPGSAIFFKHRETGRFLLRRAEAGPAARLRSCGSTDHGRSVRLLGIWPAVKPCRRDPSVPIAAVTALGFASCRFADADVHACRISNVSSRRQPREEVADA